MGSILSLQDNLLYYTQAKNKIKLTYKWHKRLYVSIIIE